MIGREVFIYVSSPVRMIRGGFRVAEVWSSDPESVWGEVASRAGVAKTDMTGVPAVRACVRAQVSKLRMARSGSRGLRAARGPRLGLLCPPTHGLRVLVRLGGRIEVRRERVHQGAVTGEGGRTEAQRGGWPGDLSLSDQAGLRARIDYLEEIRRVDIVRVDGVSRNPDNVARVLQSLARNVATPVSGRTIAAEAGGSDGPLDEDTVRGYLAALRRLMVYEEQPAWSPRLRSRSILRRSPKRHFVDPSLAVAALGATPSRLLADLEFPGLLFESMVYRDLAIHSRVCDANVYHYRDNTNLEVDILVQSRRGDWCAFEVKLGAGQVDAAAASLSKFRERVDLAAGGEPKMLGVIVGSGYGYVRNDGIAVIPIGTLAP